MEDFVPYELAVKLKQKGFKQGYNIFGYRPIFSDETTIKFISGIGAYEDEYFGENITVPTISQVLKWLREKDIMVEIPVDLGDNGIWQFTFRIQTKEFYERATKCDYASYESAALSCIEYVIDNLI